MAVSQVLRWLISTRAARREAILNTTADRIEAHWRMTDPWDGHQVATFASTAAEASTVAQEAIVSLATATQMAYLSDFGIGIEFAPDVPAEVRLFTDLASQFVTPTRVVSAGRESVRLPVAEPYQRLARSYRANVADGKPADIALAQSITRGRIVTATNLALAEREAEHQILTEAVRQGKPVIGWRRVIHPERSETGVCGLCIAASGRIYSVDELKPLHAECKCETMPVTADRDPGGALNDEDLKRLYQDAGGTGRGDLKKTRYAVGDHGELQAVLIPARRGDPVHRHRPAGRPDPVDLDAFQREHEAATRHLPLMRQILAQALARGAEEDSGPIRYQRAQIARFEAIVNG
ncbi:hypothetical protein [Nocardia puris]|uniref:Phage Mu protein F like protein n=1 Tax=Nocardia puris TaxID=208602 RepID=A0A366DD44_9NOCA|nr:hypothetical protein [Nocardia puris]RBO87971.1 hypothetical protein DFR74_110227 [Nocardia puris]